jgi:hypothetical protein
MRSLIGQSLTLLGWEEAGPVYRPGRRRQGAEMALSLIQEAVASVEARQSRSLSSALFSRASATVPCGNRPKSGVY